MPSQRDEYKDLLGMVPDEEIAEAAGVQVATVARWRRDLDIAAYAGAPGDEQVPDAGGDVDTDAGDEADADPDTDPGEGTSPEVVVAAAPDPDPGPATPKLVRARINTRVKAPDGRTLRIHFRGVYRGDLAAWLWEHHRGLVEPYTPQG